MKKIRFAPILAAVVVLASSLVMPVSAEGKTDTVFVTISDGSLALAFEEVALTDADGDGALTVNDALIAAHDKSFEGGAAAGYGSEATEYGLSMTKLWGIEDKNGGYGYYVNNASAMSLADPVKAGDHIVAFVYTDTTAFSDTYSFFDVTEASASEVTLTLSSVGFDENWAPVTSPVEGAVITVDGNKTDVKTDADGKATVKVEGEGRHVVSAVSDAVTLVPPVCIVTVKDAETTPAGTGSEGKAPPTGSETLAIAAIGLTAGAFLLTRRRIHD